MIPDRMTNYAVVLGERLVMLDDQEAPTQAGPITIT